jgi:hypothetical protein
MRVYFNLVDSAASIPDDRGVEVHDVTEAYAEAKQTIEEMLQEDEVKSDVSGWRLDAVDASGTFLFSIDLNSGVN